MNRRSWLLGALLAVLPALSHAMVFVSFEGIPSAVTDLPPYAGWFVADQYDWTLQRSGVAPVLDMKISLEQHGVGFSQLAQAAATGQVIRRVYLDDTATVGTTGRVVMVRLMLDDVTLRNFSSTGDADDLARSSLQLACAKITWEIFEYSKTGTLAKSQ